MALSGIDLNLLVALDALLTECNVTRAAERTLVGQPAMSASLARLRKHFDDPLLVREGRKLVPTPLAESLAAPVREAIVAIEAVLGSRAGFDPATDQRSFTIVASDYVTLVLLRPLFARLGVEAPGIGVNVVPLQPDFTDQLRRGQVDLLIIPTALVRREEFPHVRLFSDRFVLAADRDNSDVGERVTAEEFARLPYLSYRVGPLQALGESELEEVGIERRIEVRTQSFVITPFLLTGTRLVSLVHERLAARVAEQARLRLLEPPVPLRPIVEAMYWNPRHTQDPAHSWLRSCITEIADDL
ncbi:LysR family transcriptional regulator [Pseudonocardia zijingensis]|jgi:DNA-binding transcriptional LysR family regulator|uniref:Transcriptional regulator NodD1 n=1 Tax=Pseudonocardia zijingensis TaxID=153376 RepID=A0ABN1N8N9_9PSEU